MLSAPWTTCLWPGLTQLWVHGRWAGLVWALGFMAVLNVALISKGIWPELGHSWIRYGIWYVLFGYWLIGAILQAIPLVTGSWQQVDASVEQLFTEAQSTYLKGEWFHAEASLLRLLRHEPEDAEALLLLATLQRHTQKFDQARQTLNQLERLDDGQHWWYEIHRERQMIADREQLETSDQSATSEDVAEEDGEQNADIDQPSLPEAA